MSKINLVIFGATGSIGDSVLSIVRANKNKFLIQGITCNKNIKKLLKIANEFNVNKIGCNVKEIKSKINVKKNLKVFDNIIDFDNIVDDKTDIIIFAISGLSSIQLIFKILKRGKTIGLANKEAIVSIGNKILSESKKFSSEIIPLDSEHNSVYHLLKTNKNNFKSITITASGGPFRKLDYKNFKKITPKQALKHPTWKMGKKISIDSATMVNKALEIIEAKHLFNLEIDQINSIIHPQSIVHALINYSNGISIALMNKPDMRIPIASLFFNFDNYQNNIDLLDLSKYRNLEFFPVDHKKFPALKLGFEVMQVGGLAPHVFNYLNEKLVNAFLNKQIKFNEIVEFNNNYLDYTFKKNSNVTNPVFDDIKEINNWLENNIKI